MARNYASHGTGAAYGASSLLPGPRTQKELAHVLALAPFLHVEY